MKGINVMKRIRVFAKKCVCFTRKLFNHIEETLEVEHMTEIRKGRRRW